MTEHTKKLYRSRRDKKIAGVAGGVAEYFRVDSTIIRLVFVALIFLNLVGLVLYAIMWIIVPEAPEAAGEHHSSSQ